MKIFGDSLHSPEPIEWSRSKITLECEKNVPYFATMNTATRERDKTADFKRDKTADFQNRKKTADLKTVQNRRLVNIKIADFVNA